MRPRLKPLTIKSAENDQTLTNAPGKRRMSKIKLKFEYTRNFNVHKKFQRVLSGRPKTMCLIKRACYCYRIGLVVPNPPSWGGGGGLYAQPSFCFAVNFRRSIYSSLILWAVSTESPSSAESIIQKRFLKLVFFQGVIEVQNFWNTCQSSNVFVLVFLKFLKIF